MCCHMWGCLQYKEEKQLKTNNTNIAVIMNHNIDHTFILKNLQNCQATFQHFLIQLGCQIKGCEKIYTFHFNNY